MIQGTKTTKFNIMETNAPIPACLADLGLLEFQTQKRINPAIGIKNPKITQPKEPTSSIGSSFLLTFAEVRRNDEPI